MHQDGESERDIFRVILTRNRGAEILLEREGCGWRLPRLGVPSRRRWAELLTAETWEKWRIESCCLFFPSLRDSSDNALGTNTVVMEAAKEADGAPTKMHWESSPLALREAALRADDCRALRGALEEMGRYLAEPQRGAFARTGWIQELFGWVQELVGPLGLRLTSRFRQFNASPTFSLLRIETSDAALWFKATGEPNVHELPVTQALSHLFPRYVPELLGVHELWNGWLTREAPGSTLDSFTALPAWTRAARALAELQIASIGKSAALLESGCKDLRLPQLIEHVDPFLARVSGLMAMQTKRPPAVLTDAELRFLGRELKDACAALEEFGLPETLGHLDFNPGNILVSQAGCVFLDWAEGCVTHPLLTFEYLREHLKHHFAQDADALESIGVSYLEPWRAFGSPADLARGLSLSPLVAVFAYAAGTPAWRAPELLAEPAVAAYLRSLARRMHREALRIRERSKPCLA